MAVWVLPLSSNTFLAKKMASDKQAINDWVLLISMPWRSKQGWFSLRFEFVLLIWQSALTSWSIVWISGGK